MENKLKTSLRCYTCCCVNNNDEYTNDDVQKILNFSDHNHRNQVNLPTCPKSELLEFKDRCADILSSKFGRNRQRGGNQQVEFRYDPLSYALNFEDADSHLDDQFRPPRNFSSRLPPSPKTSSKEQVVSTQKTAWS